MMDETQDVAGYEQVIIMLRFVSSEGRKVTIEERMLALVVVGSKTGEALAEMLLNKLEDLSLDVMMLVGQCYDGGSNLSGCFNGVQIRILSINELATFVHCFAHSLNRALVNSVNHKKLPEARNFFSIFEHIVVFVGRSSQRQAYFLQIQREINDVPQPSTGAAPEQDLQDNVDDAEGTESQPSTSTAPEGTKRSTKPKLPGRSVSDTRWGSRSASMQRYTEPEVFEATVRTLKYVIDNASDSESKSTAIGLLAHITSPKFVLMLAAFRYVLLAVNRVSISLQSKTIDTATAMKIIGNLKDELQRYRTSPEYWKSSVETARVLAARAGVDFDEALSELQETTRQRKRPRKLDDRPETAASSNWLDTLRTQHFYPALDKMIAEVNTRFPCKLGDFAYLEPKHFKDPEAEDGIRRLSAKYQRFVDSNAVTEWRLFRNTEGLDRKSMVQVCEEIPDEYVSLKKLYRIFLTLPITTASLERGFSKLKLIENRLRCTQCLDRLESLMLLATEKDVASQIDLQKLVAAFAQSAERRMPLR